MAYSLTICECNCANCTNDYFKINKNLLSEEWDTDLAKGSLLCFVNDRDDVSFQLCLVNLLIFQCCPKGWQCKLQKNFGEHLLETHPVIRFSSHICLYQLHTDECKRGSKTWLKRNHVQVVCLTGK